MRKKLIAGNWKMNKTPTEAAALIGEIINQTSGATCDVAVCVPYIDIPAARDALKGGAIWLGAENCHHKESGAYTGEISTGMLKSVGVNTVIIGHSERRQYFAETDETVNLKTKAAIAAGLIPIICVGETLAQREAGYTDALVSYQTKIAYAGISEKDALNTVVAYEPVWAIGTGKTATDEEANETIGVIREALRCIYPGAAEDIRILYGGSMNEKNAAGLLAQPEIDGGLIGGASLAAEKFAAIVKAASL
ncbi:MAG: triose-phosphate isomerase [Oscillospiraceae bacterium]|jgi:triosephosphate isomerase|nr:triose-phosphate isomerase [Oscillospiraceae bacterium]